MWWNWLFGFLLLGSSLFTYAMGRVIARGGGRAAVGLAVAVHLGVLGSFKYSDFLIGAANGVLHGLGSAHELPFLGLILPVGISFFTFHGISYVVDVYRGDVAVCRRLDDMLLYIAFFPQLVAGPIVRAAFFLPQLYAPAPATLPLGPPLLLIAGGLVKKMLLANYIGTELVDPVFFDPSSFSAVELVLAAYGYAVQIYCDFSGYTDIAIGLAALLGYRFPPNFNQPYRSSSLQEFWRRWHISLSSWLRDYLYKPIGGSQHGRARTVFALMATMLLGGLWHGASWHYVIWGALHGAALVAERFARAADRPAGGALGEGRCDAAGVPFRLPDLDCLPGRFVGRRAAVCAGDRAGRRSDHPGAAFHAGAGCVWAAAAVYPAGLDGAARPLQRRLTGWALAAAAGVSVTVIDALGPDGVAPFIYFQF